MEDNIVEELRGAIKQAEQQIEQQKALGHELFDEGFALPLLRKCLTAFSDNAMISRECAENILGRKETMSQAEVNRALRQALDS